MNFSNYQINQFVDLGGGQTAISLRNAAEVRTYGAEAEGRLAVIDGVLFGVNLALINAEFEDFADGGGTGVNLAGNSLPHATEFTSSLFADVRQRLTQNLDFKILADYNHRSSSFSGPENIDRQRLDARDIVNVRAGFASSDDLWAVEAFVDNLFDEDYALTRERDFFGTLIVERGAPRTYGVALRTSF